MCLLGQKALQAGKGRSLLSSLPALATGLGCLGRARRAWVSLAGTSTCSGRVSVGPARLMVAVGAPRCLVLLVEMLMVQAGERWFMKTEKITTASWEPPAPSACLHGPACPCHQSLALICSLGARRATG